MKTGKTITLVLLSLLLFVNVWAWMAGMTVERTVLSVRFYDRLMERSELPEALHQMIFDSFTEQMEENLEENDGFDLGPTEQEAVMTMYVNAMADAADPDWLQEQISMVVNSILDYIKGDSDTLEAVIDLSEWKDRFRDALAERITKLPDTIQVQLYAMGEDADSLADRILEETEFPDELDVFENAEIESIRDYRENADHPVPRYRPLWRFIPIGFALVLTAVMLLVDGPARGVKWFGVTLIVSGALYYIPLQLVRSILVPILLRRADADFPLDPEVVARAIRYIYERIVVLPVAVIVIGILTLLIRYIVIKTQAAKQPPQPLPSTTQTPAPPEQQPM